MLLCPNVDTLALLSGWRYGWYTTLGTSTGLMAYSFSPSTSDRHGVAIRTWDGGIGLVDGAAGGGGGEMLLPMKLKDGCVASVSVSFLFFWCVKRITIAATIANAAAPPTAPPMIIPVLLDELLSFCSESSGISLDVDCKVVTTV